MALLTILGLLESKRTHFPLFDLIGGPMPTLKLTTTTLKKLRAPDPSGKQVIHWDETLRGFAVLC
jgi:hypothetical protein